MMVKKKSNHLPIGNGGGFQRKGGVVCGERSQRKSSEPFDHWGFLEEIDAPMWVDLSLESTYKYQDIDDHWFQVTHPFHEHSSRYLSSGFSNSGEEKACSEADLLGPSSPKLPSSVSRSRGKHFRSKKWRGDDHVPVDERQQIRKFSRGTQRKISACNVKTKSSSGESKCSSSMKAGLVAEISTIDTKPNAIQTKCRFQNPRHESNSIEAKKPSLPPAKTSSVYVRSSLSLASSSIGESNLTSNSGPDSFEANYGSLDLRSSSTKMWNPTRTKCSFGDSESTLSSLDATFVGECNSASSKRPDSPKSKLRFGDLKSSFNSKKVSNVSESGQQERQMGTNVSCQTFGQQKGLLSAARISLPKRSVTKQSSRVEVKDKRQLKGLKSSLSKFSVGFSSNSGSNISNTSVTTAMNLGRNAESENLIKMDKTTNHRKGEGRNASKTSNGPLMDVMSRSGLEGKNTNINCFRQETSKAKVLPQFETRKPALMHHKVINPPKVQSKEKKILVNKNQVKAREHAISSQKGDGREHNIGTIGWNQKTLKHRSEVNEKGLPNLKAKVIGRTKLENSKRMVERIYFR